MKILFTALFMPLLAATHAQTLSVPGGVVSNSNGRNVELIDGSINVKSDPYSFIGVERLNGATIRIGVTSGGYEGHLSSSGSIKFLTNDDATPKMFINSNGRIGIGTKAPTQKLEVVDGSILVKSDPYAFIGLERSNGAAIQMGITTGSTEAFITSTGSMKFLTNAEASPKMFISYNGNVGIGTNNATDKLTVAGNIHSREVKVTVDAGADFVFESDYSLRSLEEVSAFVQENKHLPEIPSEKEMLERGLELGEMNIKLLQKVEELTLYLIQQHEINKTQAEEIAELRLKLEKVIEQK